MTEPESKWRVRFPKRPVPFAIEIALCALLIVALGAVGTVVMLIRDDFALGVAFFSLASAIGVALLALSFAVQQRNWTRLDSRLQESRHQEIGIWLDALLDEQRETNRLLHEIADRSDPDDERGRAN